MLASVEGDQNEHKANCCFVPSNISDSIFSQNSLILILSRFPVRQTWIVATNREITEGSVIAVLSAVRQLVLPVISQAVLPSVGSTASSFVRQLTLCKRLLVRYSYERD